MKKFFVLACFVLGTPLIAGKPDAILGVWKTSANDTIEIYKCGKKICGRIKDAAEPLYPAGDEMAGKSKVDRHNPKKSRRNDPIIGLVLLKDFKYEADDDYWQGGTIYDPKNGKTYKCKATLEGEELHVRGYIGFALIGRTEIWTRSK